MKNFRPLDLQLEDTQWPCTYTDCDRQIARAIAVDAEGYFQFVRVSRDDDFGRADYIESAGGGVEPGEDLSCAVLRELKEELGACAEVISPIGTVSDYYNAIHRHNINNYFLCRIHSFGETQLTSEEINNYHLKAVKLSFEEALAEYELGCRYPIGRLVAARELPVLKRAKEILDGQE